MEKWDKWDKRFMELCSVIANWSSCYQENRKMCALIVKDKRILTTGYNGAPAGVKSCVERGRCLRRDLNIPSGTLSLIHIFGRGVARCAILPTAAFSSKALTVRAMMQEDMLWCFAPWLFPGLEGFCGLHWYR